MTITLPTDGYRFGYVEYAPGATLGPRVQRNLQLVYFYRGDCRVSVDGTPVVVPHRYGVLLFPGATEYFEFACDTQTHHGWAEYVPGRGEVSPWSALLPIVAPFSDDMLEIARGGFLASRRTTVSMPSARDAVARLLFEAFLSQSEMGVSDERRPTQLARVLGYIDDHWADAIDLPILAAVGAVSTTHLNRLFRRYCATTAMRYLRRYRASQALTLIRGTSLSLQQIAEHCGFANPFHLSRTIAHEFGKPPIEIRRDSRADQFR
jgi:AraC-like DNA-binding protein